MKKLLMGLLVLTMSFGASAVTKKQLKKLPLEQLVAVVGSADGYELDASQFYYHVSDFDNEEQLLEFAEQVKIYTDSESHHLRSSYERYLNNLYKKHNCWDEVADPDGRNCYSYAFILTDSKGAFVVGIVIDRDGNGTDDYDNDSGNVRLYNWHGKELYYNEWSEHYGADRPL
jgi:hypothetical protein